MQIHSITNQHKKHIIDYKIRDEICHMLNNALDYTYVQGKKIEIIKDHRHSDGSRDTVVSVDFS